tara:strand:- start:129 stop:1142 length:1014 start_codon:yes stop_codon:yes gene_type:complete
MDPISQGVVGAAVAQASANKKNILGVGVIGILAGLAPDLDIFIRSSTDPILFLEYHRQFSHSLIFIPVGALLVAIPIFCLVKKSMSFKVVYVASFLGYATHGLLDACTSWGTLLFWPFSDIRVSWSNISIVDPLFTIPVVIFVAVAMFKRKKIFSLIAIGWIAFYLSLGFIQYERTYLVAVELAKSRGHNPEHLTLKPSFGNLILWKSIYLDKRKFYVDAIRTVKSSTICPGESIEEFSFEKHLPNLNRESQQAKDIERFRWFAQDYLGFDDENNIVIDIRYSNIPNQIKPMWGLAVDFNHESTEHAIWWTNRTSNQNQLNTLKDMLVGKSCKDLRN